MKRKGLYYGKTQIYNFLKENFFYEMPILKHCSYKKSHGIEWFSFTDSSYIITDVSFVGCRVHIKRFFYNESCVEILLSNECFILSTNGNLSECDFLLFVD